MVDVEQVEQIAGNIHTAIFTEKTNAFQCKKYFLTYHIKDNESFESVFEKLKDLGENLCDKYIFGEEYGKTGSTPHIQGAFILAAKMRADTLQKAYFKNGATLRKLKNWNCAFNYCRKEGHNIISNCEIPEEVHTISPDFKWEEDILEILKKNPDDRKIYWYWGDGGVGKTAFCKYLTMKHQAICVGGKGADMRNAIVEYKKTNGNTPKLILINIPKSHNAEYFSYEGMENIKDMYFYSGKYEGGMICGNPPHLFVFANVEPAYDMLSADRWVIKEIN